MIYHSNQSVLYRHQPSRRQEHQGSLGGLLLSQALSLISKTSWPRTRRLRHRIYRLVSPMEKVSAVQRLRMPSYHKKNANDFSKLGNSGRQSRNHNQPHQLCLHGRQPLIESLAFLLQLLQHNRHPNPRRSPHERPAHPTLPCGRLLQRKVYHPCRRTRVLLLKVLKVQPRPHPHHALALPRPSEACQSRPIPSQLPDLFATFPCRSTHQPHPIKTLA
jgi:hypothetical protein